MIVVFGVVVILLVLSVSFTVWLVQVCISQERELVHQQQIITECMKSMGTTATSIVESVLGRLRPGKNFDFREAPLKTEAAAPDSIEAALQGFAEALKNPGPNPALKQKPDDEEITPENIEAELYKMYSELNADDLALHLRVADTVRRDRKLCDQVGA